MQSAKLFQNGQSQAVRLPKEFRFKGSEVYVKKVPNGVLLISKDKPWDGFFTSLDKFTPDFMDERSQPSQQSREDL